MTRKVFIDTGAFYARYVAADQYHQKALSGWQRIRAERITPATSNFVIGEFLTLLSYRFGHASALKAGREVYGSAALEIIQIERECELMALDWLKKFSDKRFSMTDATSFSLMSLEGLKESFSFDNHFEQAGFSLFG